MNKWSSFQEEIFAWSGDRHLMVEAGAGCGKTTTIVELYLRLMKTKPELKVLFLAFNKKIAVELQERGVPASTLNAYGLKILTKNYGRVKVDTWKINNICADLSVPKQQHFLVKKVVGLIKSNIVRPEDVNDSVILDTISEYSVEVAADKLDKFVEHCKAVFRRSILEHKNVDFDDMLCLPVYRALMGEMYDVVIVDEAQDLSTVKLELVQLGMKGKLVTVGDPKQAIYGFCGADSNSMNRIKLTFNPVVKTLPVTYRCGKAIVAEVHRLGVCGTDYQAGETNHLGRVDKIDMQMFPEQVKVKDFVLCRMTAPLVTEAFKLIRRGIRAQIIGRDIGTKLSALVDKIVLTKPDTESLEEMSIFANKLGLYSNKELNKLLELKKETKAQQLEDQLDCISSFAEDSESVTELKSKIDKMFDDDLNPDKVIFSTIHKAKGLEADNVFALPSRKFPNSDEEEEKNLLYVMVTRAKERFVWIQ